MNRLPPGLFRKTTTKAFLLVPLLAATLPLRAATAVPVTVANYSGMPVHATAIELDAGSKGLRRQNLWRRVARLFPSVSTS